MKFESPQLLQRHLIDHHSRSFTESQLSVLLDMCERPADPEEMGGCPLCGAELTIWALKNHVASHLEDLALFVLPYGADDQDDVANSKDAERVGGDDDRLDNYDTSTLGSYSAEEGREVPSQDAEAFERELATKRDSESVQIDGWLEHSRDTGSTELPQHTAISLSSNESPAVTAASVLGLNDSEGSLVTGFTQKTQATEDRASAKESDDQAKSASYGYASENSASHTKARSVSQVLQVREKALGVEHPDTLSSVRDLASILQDQGKLMEAEKMYRRALQGREKILGVESPSTLSSVRDLASILRDQGKLVEAEKMYQRALHVKEKAWGLEHPFTLDTGDKLGNMYRDQGKMNEAEDMYRRALAGKEKILGLVDTSTLDTVGSLGKLYMDQGKMKEAEGMHLRALTGFTKTLGPEHTSTLDTRYALGILYKTRSQFGDAVHNLELAVQGYTKVLGTEHWKTVEGLQQLEDCKSRLEEMKEVS